MLSFLLYLDVLIVLLQQAVVLWHVVGSEMFSFQCGQRTESLTFVSYIIGDTFRYRRLLCYVGQYGYMGLVLALALIANFVAAKLISQGARTPVALAVLMYPFKSHMMNLWYRAPWLLPCPLSNKYLMSLCINLIERYNVFSHSQFDIYSLLLYVIFPVVSISCAVACSFKLSSDTPWQCFVDVVRIYRGEGNGLFNSCKII